MPEKDSFHVRVKNAINGSYRPCMWRSFQSIALYEADRCLKDRYPHLKPFQKQTALLATAVDLTKTLGFLNDGQIRDIMFIKKATKKPLTHGLAWRRMVQVSTEINEKILPKAKALVANRHNRRKTHDEICELILESMFEEIDEDSKRKNRPPTWEFYRVNAFIVYRVYYRGVDVDPSIFPATPPRVVKVPMEKPPNSNQSLSVAVGGDSSFGQFDDSVDLTEEQKQHFVQEGYLLVKQVVPEELVEAALGAINAALCNPGGNVDTGDDNTEFCPGLGKSDAILNLVKHSAVWTLAQRFLGKGNIQDVTKGQIALRPPILRMLAAGGPEEHDPSLPPRSWHVDGMDKKKFMSSPFSMLVGVALSDVLTENCGNLCVSPKSHQKLLPLIKERIESELPMFNEEKNPDKPAFDNMVHVLAEAGDVVFAHQKTAHRPGPNASHMIRYQVYFRLTHKDHTRNMENGSLLEDLFVEFEGLSKN